MAVALPMLAALYDINDLYDINLFLSVFIS